MVSDQTKNELWQQLFDIERNCRYYESLYTRTARWHFGIRFGTLTLIVVGIFAIPDSWPWFHDWIKAVIAFFAVVLTIWDVVSNHSKRVCEKSGSSWLESFEHEMDHGDINPSLAGFR